MSQTKPIKKYFNKKQLEAMTIAPKNEYIVASRGFGKSEGVDAPRLIRNVFAMPRSAGGLLSPTYGKLLRNTLPAVFASLERLGYKRDIHFVVGRKPHQKLNFKKPIIEPFNYDYVIAWFNGSIQNMLSFDRPMSANSMNLDYILGFEAKYLNYDKVKNEVFPANRGNLNYFADCPWHHGVVFSTDMPTSKAGMWILDKEKDMDRTLIELIKLTYRKYKSTTSEQLRAKYFRELQLYRKNATFYAEYDAFDNIEILGEDYIKSMHRDLPPIIFATAVLNKRFTRHPNGFYASFSQALHTYVMYNNSYLESLDYDVEKTTKETCLKDGDINPDIPLSIALDYNAAINSLVVGQKLPDSNEGRTLKSMVVKTPRKIKDVVNDFCDYYDSWPNHDVIYFYDSTAVADTPSEGSSFADTVIETLIARKWDVTPIYIGQQVKFHLRHMYIDLGFKGDQQYLFPTFNADNNEYLILAMEQAGVKISRSGFEKDKDDEKLDDSPDNPDELKTHITDAWDTLYMGLNFHYPTQLNSSYQLTRFNQ